LYNLVDLAYLKKVFEVLAWAMIVHKFLKQIHFLGRTH
jgi:hypothetical protein